MSSGSNRRPTSQVPVSAEATPASAEGVSLCDDAEQARSRSPRPCVCGVHITCDCGLYDDK